MGRLGRSNQICARICAQDAAGRLETRETQRAGYERPPSVLRDQRGDQRRCETAETDVVWLITQRSRVQIPPPLPRPEALSRTEKGPFACGVCTDLRTGACSSRALTRSDLHRGERTADAPAQRLPVDPGVERNSPTPPGDGPSNYRLHSAGRWPREHRVDEISTPSARFCIAPGSSRVAVMR